MYGVAKAAPTLKTPVTSKHIPQHFILVILEES